MRGDLLDDLTSRFARSSDGFDCMHLLSIKGKLVPRFSATLRVMRGTVWDGKGSLVAGLLAAVGASVCCVGPLVLLALGIGGAWISNLTALEPYRPVLIAATLLFLGLAFRRLYLLPAVCAPGAVCADLNTRRRQRLVFWVVSALLLALIAVPWMAPLFY
jgi:mercuric ion transport protein